MQDLPQQQRLQRQQQRHSLAANREVRARREGASVEAAAVLVRDVSVMWEEVLVCAEALEQGEGMADAASRCCLNGGENDISCACKPSCGPLLFTTTRYVWDGRTALLHGQVLPAACHAGTAFHYQ